MLGQFVRSALGRFGGAALAVGLVLATLGADVGCEPRRGATSRARRLQISLAKIAGGNRTFHSICGFGTRPVRLDRRGLL
jgi:hypothetical protein